MKEEELISLFEKGLKLIRKSVIEKTKDWPLYGSVVYLFSSTLVDSLGSFLEGEFDEVYKEKLSALHVPILGGTALKLSKFYNHYPSLKEEYNVELSDLSNQGNVELLRKSYEPLYKIIVSQDIFMLVAYAKEIALEDWRGIVADYRRKDTLPSKLQHLLNEVSPTIQENADSFWDIHDFFKDYYKKLSTEIKNDAGFRKLLSDVLKKTLGKIL